MKKPDKESDHFSAWVENGIIILIILVIVHTILDDLAILFHLSHTFRSTLIVSGFMFDLVFTIEFIARMLISRKRAGIGFYVKHQRGWIDGLSSLPLLVFVSGPALVLLLFDHDDAGIGLHFFAVLKTVKAIRVTRILRLIRVVKLFGKIQNTESIMTGRHVGAISTIAVVSLIFVLMMVEFIPGLRVGNHGDYYRAREMQMRALLGDEKSNMPHKISWLRGFLENSPQDQDVIRLEDSEGRPVYIHRQEKELRWTAYSGAPILVGSGYRVILSYHPADAEHARVNLLILIGILVVIAAMMLIYTGFFARHVADPIFIMNRGLREMDYNLEVRIDTKNRNDEIYRLASAFNLRWLPLKNRINNYRRLKQKSRSAISVKDVL